MFWIVFFLVLSLFLNVLLLWYIRGILVKLLYTSDNLGDLYIVFQMFEDFVEQMYNMDSFYGEPIIEELIEKTKAVRVEIENFRDIYELTTAVERIKVDETQEI